MMRFTSLLVLALSGCTLIEGFDRFRAGDAGNLDAGSAVDAPADAAIPDAPTDAAIPVDAGSATLSIAFVMNFVPNVGTGAIVSAPGLPAPGLSCAATGSGCSVDVPAGSSVTLEAVPWVEVTFWGEGTGCAGRRCTVAVTADRTLTLAVRPIGNLAFVTSTLLAASDPRLASEGAASSVCNTAASAVGLPGSWRAFFGPDRNAQYGVLGPFRNEGWVRLDGRPIALVGATFDTSIAPLVHPLDIDERGAVVPVDFNAVAYTGTPSCGAPLTTAGHVHSVTGGFAAGNYDCGSAGFAGRLYCFQVPAATEVLPVPVADPDATYLFVSSIPTSTSRADLDARCQADALAATLPGSSTPNTYRALLGLPTGSPLSIVSAERLAAPLLRSDHRRLVDQTSELFSANPLLTAPILDAGGVAVSTLVMTGWALSDPEAGVPSSETCDGWMAGALGNFGAAYPGNAAWPESSLVVNQDAYARVYGSFTRALGLPCSTPQPVYCIRAN